MDTESPVAGWYADPFERFQFRYWDGARWSGYAANGSDVAWDDVEPANAGVAEKEIAPALPGIVTAFLGYGIGVALAISIGIALDHNGKPGGFLAGLILTQCGLWAGLIGAPIVVSKRRGTGSLRKDFDWRFRKADIGFGLAGALAGRIVSALVIAPIPLPFHHPTAPERGVFDRAGDRPIDWLVLVVIVCIGAPLIEELFFRGLLQPRVIERLGPVVGIPVVALLFGAAHLTNWQGSATFIYAFSIAGGGLVLGLIRYVTGRLGPSTWAHFFFNAQAVLLTFLLR